MNGTVVLAIFPLTPEVIRALLFKIAVGLILGFIVGFLIKKLLSFLLLISFLYLGTFIWMDSEGIITIHWGTLRTYLFSIPPFSGNVSLLSAIGLLIISFIIGVILGTSVGGEA